MPSTAGPPTPGSKPPPSQDHSKTVLPPHVIAAICSYAIDDDGGLRTIHRLATLCRLGDTSANALVQLSKYGPRLIFCHFNALPPWFKTEFFREACEKGDVAALQWAVTAGVEFDTNRGTDTATVNGQVGVLNWWRQSGLDLTHEKEMDRASEAGHVHSGHDVEPFDCILNRLVVTATLNIHENGSRVLKHFSLPDAVFADGNICDCALSPATSFPNPRNSDLVTITIVRSIFVRIVLNALVMEGVYVHLGKLLFRNGTFAFGDVLIGAGGVHSAICRTLFPTRHPVSAGMVSYFGIIDLCNDWHPLLFDLRQKRAELADMVRRWKLPRVFEAMIVAEAAKEGDD
ncbi:hypothetical protein DFJ73DRAFT_782621 [Zopfochytrium polystomum]|nr:hypothetical protein DFJ73DRAFT_782621 [Zopfochytrium polystomum]